MKKEALRDEDQDDLTPTGHSYLRFSSKKQGKGDSIRRQTEDTIAGESPATWCARNKVRLSMKSYRDMGLSAWTGKNVTQGDLKLFLDAIKTGEVRPGDFLLVEKIDRISRQGVDEGMDVIKQILRAGVSIVILSNGKVFGPDALKGLMKGLLELQIMLEQAKEYSDNLSKRVGSAWQRKKEKARENKTIATACLPPWLAIEGKGDLRRAVVISDKADVVRRIFDMAVSGQGLTRIVRTLIKDNVGTITRRGTWSRTSIRRILTDRSVLGEFQPRHGPSGGRKPDGAPIEGYYDAIVSPAVFHQAASALIGRKDAKKGRDSKRFNLFSGMLKDARSGASYIAKWRVETGDVCHQVLISATKTGAGASFNYAVLEAAVLEMLEEIDPTEILPPKPGNGVDRVRELNGELEGIKARIALAEEEFVSAADEDEARSAQRQKKLLIARQKEIAGKLADARRETDSPLSESWGAAQTLLGTLAAAPDRDAAMLRLRAVLRRVIEEIRMLVVPRVRNRDRIAVVQLFFHGSDSPRSYLILQRPPRANQTGRIEGGWWGRSWTDEELRRACMPAQFDLRNEDPTFLASDDEGHEVWVSGWKDWEEYLQVLSTEDIDTLVFGGCERHELP